MTDQKRLIEVAFPLEQTSIDSVHEKNVRRAHISTMHIWPARRPLAASRAALIATLLPDTGDKQKRDEILDRLAGRVVKKLKGKTLPSGKVEEIESKETEGGVLHWGRESGPDLDWFRQEILKAYGGRAPKVLDPFAGGGAIPLEAMRLGCEVTAVDVNPVAWFILKCTLDYPQKFAGQKRKLPDFVLREPAFMENYISSKLPDYLRSKGERNEAEIKRRVTKYVRQRSDVAQSEFVDSIVKEHGFLEAELAWHVRAWGYWILRRTRRELSPYYPTYAEFCSIKPYARVALARPDEEQLKLVPTNDDGEAQIDLLNVGFDRAYLENEKNPRWIAKPTVAYMWARTVKCKACRATVPLLKTRWLAKKNSRRALLTMHPNADRTGVDFDVESDVKIQGGNAAQRREHDKKIGIGTMSKSGAQCFCCAAIMTMGDIQLEGRAGKLGAVPIAAVTESPKTKEFRPLTAVEIIAAQVSPSKVKQAFVGIELGIPTEPISPNRPSPNTRGASGLPRYGISQWKDVFTDRQLVSASTLLSVTRDVFLEETATAEYPEEWLEAMYAYLVAAFDKLLTNSTNLCTWNCNTSSIRHTFGRFVLPMIWDFVELNILSDTSGAYVNAFDWVAEAQIFASNAVVNSPPVNCVLSSSTSISMDQVDVVLTDPPYYDAIPYSDLMDFYHVWLRRAFAGKKGFSKAFNSDLGPKWNSKEESGELVDQPSRFENDGVASRRAYEDGMAQVFLRCHAALKPDGRLVVVFANKQPEAWATLVSALIRAGFVVDGSWPIQTERQSRSNAIVSAALASSVWLVCRKRDPMKRAGWDTDVLKEMESNITQRLRDFWDAGIKGPDFVWAATGPAMEAYSQYPVVKKATESGALMTVNEFLRHVRRIVVDFVIGRVLNIDGANAEVGAISLDDVTTYYLLHRHDFGLKDAPAGACILYAVSCGLNDRLLADQYEILSRGKGAAVVEDEDDDESAGDAEGESDEVTVGSGGQFKLLAWNQRKHKSLGLDPGSGRPVPLIDQVHKLMQLWKGGDENKVNDYLEQRGLRRSSVFDQLLQSLIERSRQDGQAEECAILEKLSNHLRKIGATAQASLSGV